MGAVPVGHNSIIDLKDVPCEEVDMGETNAYHFVLKDVASFPALTDDDRNILNIVIEKLGKMSKNEIVGFMHKPGTRKVLKIKHFLYFLVEFTNDLPIILESRACRF